MNLAQVLQARWAATPALESLFPARQVITGSYFAVDPGSRFATITLPGGKVESYANDGSAVDVVLVRIALCHDDYQQGRAAVEAVLAAFDRSAFDLAGADKVVVMQKTAPPQEAQDPNSGRWTWNLDFQCRVSLAGNA